MIKFKKLIPVLLCMALLAGCGSTSTGKNESVGSASEQETNEVIPFDEKSLLREMPAPAESFAGGDGSAENPFQISTPEELYRFSYVMDSENFTPEDEEYAVEFRTLHYVLTADIVLNDVSDYDGWLDNAPENGWRAIHESFTGHLDGAGHTITGLYCYSAEDTSRVADAGLFENILNEALVENLNLEKCLVISAKGEAGGIAGSVYGAAVRNCKVEGTVLGDNLSVGGIAGTVDNGILEDCSFAGEVENSNVAGGIAGSAYGSVVENCIASGKVSAQGATGGIVGSLSSCNSVTDNFQEKYPALWKEIQTRGAGIRSCINESSVYSSGSEAGGIVANAGAGLGVKYWGLMEIAGCQNKGTVESGGGSVKGRAAGICGYLATITAKDGEETLTEEWYIRNCVNSGEISCPEGIAAGILAEASMKQGILTLTGCENSGAISIENAECLGGITGKIISKEGGTVSLEGLYNTANLTAPASSYTGGIVGNVMIVGRDDDKVAFYIRDCESAGDIIAGELAHYGGICGNFFEGIDYDDFRGVFELENCKCKAGLPAVSSTSPLYEYIEELVETLEE